MKKQIKIIAMVLSLSLLMAGCKGKNNQQIVENDMPEQDVVENEVTDIADAEIQFDKDLKYDTYFETKVVDPSERDKSSDETNNNNSVEQKEYDKDFEDYRNCNYDAVDLKGLSKETLNLFGTCALYMEDGTNTVNGDSLSSKKYSDIQEFLFHFLKERDVVEKVYDHTHNPSEPSTLIRLKYEDFEYLLKEVLNENNPETVRNKLPNKRISKETEVYYSSDDNYIYIEWGAIGWFGETEVRDIKREGDAFIITYDLFDIYEPGTIPYKVVEVTISESNNKYGYSLVAVDVIREFDWRDISK